MKDANCKCFTGRISRLVNCLVGFYDDIKIIISDSEQIGNIISLIGKKLKLDNSYTIDKHKIMLIKNCLKEVLIN